MFWRDWKKRWVITTQRCPFLALLINAGGHLKPDPYNTIATLAEEYGYEAAGEVAAFEASHVDALKELIEQEGIDCDFVVTRALDVQFSDEHCQRLKAGYDKLLDAGVAAAKNTFYVPQKAAEGVSLPIVSVPKPHSRVDPS